MFLPLDDNDEEVAAAPTEQWLLLLAYLVIKPWACRVMSSDEFRASVVAIAGLSVITVAIWAIAHLFHWMNEVWDWFVLSKPEKEKKRLEARRVELNLALKNANRRRAKATTEADRVDMDLEIGALESQLVRAQDRLDEFKSKDKEAERKKREKEARIEYEQKKASLTKERTEEVKHRRSKTPTG